MIDSKSRGERSFLEQPQVGRDNADLVFMGLPLDVTSSYIHGSARAPEAIIEASCALEEWDLPLEVAPFIHLSQHTEILDLHNRREHLEEDLDRIVVAARDVSPRAIVLGMGGDHSVTPALVAARMPRRGTVVQIDAHMDLRDEYDGSSHSHACPMRRVFEMEHNLIQIGIRSADKAETEFAKQHPDRIHTYFDHDGSKETEQDCLARVRGIEGPVYLTVDVDGLEPQLSPGTGTPLPGGLSWRALQDVIRALFEAPRAQFMGADVVECIPTAETVINESVAASILFRLAAHVARQRL